MAVQTIVKGRYLLTLEQQPSGVWRISLHHPDKGRYFSFPAGVRLEYADKVCDCAFSHYFQDEAGRLIFRRETPSPEIAWAELSFTLEEEDIVVSFSAAAAQNLAVESAELFREGGKGLYMVDCIRYFAPAPRNYQGINRAFHKSFCDCSMDGYFTPPPLNLSIGNHCGWVSFGLLDLPNSFHYQLTPRLGILVERPAGQIATPAGTVYQAPRLLLTFPEDEWEGEALFRQKLEEKGLISHTLSQKDTYPDWWQRPFVVTYGDQMLELQYNWYTDDDWGAPGYTQDWLSRWLDRAEETLDNRDFTIMVDAFWQHRYSAQPTPDLRRFPNLRGFIDECHRRGHKVLLWTAPLIDNVGNGFVPLSQEMGVLSDDAVPGLDAGCRYIDFTSDKISGYFARLSQLFFGKGEGELDCDGLKMDFLAYSQPPEGSHFQHPENGIGVKGMYRFYSLFDREARKVKSDVLLNGSACDPRFDEILHMNRLHDIQNVYEERETRARASVLAAPGMLVDSDGAIMLSTWVEETYLNAVIYSTPSLYYINKFHDGLSLSREKMAALGRLLALSARKPWGAVRFLSPGNWRLERDGKVLAASFDGHTLLLQDVNGQRLHLFSWKDGMQTLPLFGMKLTGLPEGFSVKGDFLTGSLVSGEVCSIDLQPV